MRKSKRLPLLIGIVWVVCILIFFVLKKEKPIHNEATAMLSYTIALEKVDFRLFWKNDTGKIFKSIQNLKNYVEAQNKQLVFAMNAGMFKADNTPQGLYIQEGKEIYPMDKDSARGNFYLKPNGVFYTTTDNHAFICKTEDFVANAHTRFATQSGPMLLIGGKIHPAFTQGSTNVNIRNGVGILPNGQIVFAMSQKEINLYDFALYFQQLDCKNALYLDGFVSRTYLPSKNWEQLDGNFGVMIGVLR
jgi:uncharacterized protein YigE (DUF2233 family)